MATKTVVELIDDLDGSAAEETVPFALDGVHFEIDLSERNAGILRDILGDYLTHGRKTGKAGAPVKTRSVGTAPVKPGREQNQAIREWAKRNGLPVSERGRIAAGVQRAFDDAHPGAMAATG